MKTEQAAPGYHDSVLLIYGYGYTYEGKPKRKVKEHVRDRLPDTTSTTFEREPIHEWMMREHFVLKEDWDEMVEAAADRSRRVGRAHPRQRMRLDDLPLKTRRGARVMSIPLHLKNYDFSRNCRWCGTDLLVVENPDEIRVTKSKKLWLDSPDCCKLLHPVTLAVFEGAENPYMNFGMDEDAINIDDEVLAERVLRFTPLVLRSDGLHRIEPVDPRKTAFTWDPKLKDTVEVREIMVTPTFHSCGYAAFFKPSISEVLAQVPDDPDINAFYIETDTVKVTTCGGGHLAKTHWVSIVPAHAEA